MSRRKIIEPFSNTRKIDFAYQDLNRFCVEIAWKIRKKCDEFMISVIDLGHIENCQNDPREATKIKNIYSLTNSAADSLEMIAGSQRQNGENPEYDLTGIREMDFENEN